MWRPVKQRGAALILAIMITVLVAVIATSMLVSHHLSIFETSLINNNAQMIAANAGVTDQLRQQLLQLASKNKRKIMTFAGPFSVADFHGVSMSAVASDAMGRFNVNCLAQTANVPAFARLVRAVSPGYDQKAAMALALQVSAWVSPSRGQRAGYQEATMYQLAHRPFAHISQLRLVSGVTADLMRRLAPYVIALPPQVKMNVNAVSAPVLYALLTAKNVTLDKAGSVVACRKNARGFKDAQALTKCLAAQNIDSQSVNNRLITFDSKYFLLRNLVKLDRQHLLISSLIYIGASIPSWQAAITPVKNKSVKRTTPATLGSLSAVKPRQKPLRSFVLWQSQ